MNRCHPQLRSCELIRKTISEGEEEEEEEEEEFSVTIQSHSQ
jgi:hypothetical protein